MSTLNCSPTALHYSSFDVVVVDARMLQCCVYLSVCCLWRYVLW